MTISIIKQNIELMLQLLHLKPENAGYMVTGSF